MGSNAPYRPPSALSQDYENVVTSSSSAEFVALRHGKTISTANFVTSKSIHQHRSVTPTTSFQGQSRIPSSTTPTLSSKIPTRKA
jgi:hypothetical protein